jgi:DNA-binding transcriptional LysR family regulator
MTSRLPDLDDLLLLVRVARTDSIGAAALEHGLSQPSASRRLSALERRLGFTLLARSRRGTVLTARGRVVVDWAETLLAAAEDFGRSVETLRRGRSATVRVAVSMTIAEHLAPHWLTSLHQLHPDLQVALMVHNSAEAADLVTTGKADLGFIETPRLPRDLRRRRVGRDRLVVAVAPGHAWARRRTPLTPDELAHSFLLVREPGSGTRETLEDALAGRGLALTDEMVMGSNSALRSAALSGLGPVVLSDLALDPDVRAGRLVEVETVDLSFQRPLTAVWRRDEPLPEPAIALLKVALATG